MKNTYKFEPSCIYLFKSLSCGNSSYFESDDEIEQFERLFRNHLKNYIKIIKAEFNQEGYAIIIQVRCKRTLINNYKIERKKREKEVKEVFTEEPWRIISEKIRQIHSLFVRYANRLRDRSGVLVKKAYERFYFESKKEAIKYFKKELNIEINSQNNSKYKSNKTHCILNSWKDYAKKMVEGIGFRGIEDLVLLKSIDRTFRIHNST